MDETRRTVGPGEADTPALAGEPGGDGLAVGPDAPPVASTGQASERLARVPPLGPKRLHAAWILLSLVGLLRGFAIPLVLVLIGGGERGQVWFVIIGGAVALLGIAAQTASWLRLHYEVTGGELRVRSGIVSRHERSVPLERIQAVDSSESVLQRLFGVVQVRIETAAGGANRSDVTLEALSHADAEALLARLAVRSPSVSPAGTMANSAATAVTRTDPLAAQGELLHHITWGELLVAGLTSGRVGPALALLVAGWQLFDDVFGEDAYERLAMEAPEPSVGVFAVIGLVIAAVAWLLAIAGTVLTFANFELRRAGDRLLISHGLLDRRRSTIPLRRIQAVTIQQGLLRQPFGLATVRVESAGYGQDSAVSGVLSPIVRLAAVPELLRAACPELTVERRSLDGSALRRLPPRARIRYVMAEVWQTLALVAGATALTAIVPGLRWWWGAALLGLLPVSALYGLLQYLGAGWTIDTSDRLVVRGWGLARRIAIVPRRRVQLRSVTQNVLQRRADLANIHVAVASGGSGGRVALRHLDVAEAYEIAERLGPAPALGRTPPSLASIGSPAG